MSAVGASGDFHKGHRKRLRDLMLRNGLDAVSEINILEMLLFSTITRGDTNPTAHRLLDRFHSLVGVFEASEEELRKVEGIGAKSAAFLHHFPALFQAYPKSIKRARNGDFSCADEINEMFVSRFRGLDEEAVYVLLLTADGHMRYCQAISHGPFGQVMPDIYQIVNLCAVYRCSYIVIAENHPEGYALPTKQDLDAARTLLRVLQHFSVRLYDYLIISEDAYTSMRTADILKRLQAENRLEANRENSENASEVEDAEPTWHAKTHTNPYEDQCALQEILHFILPESKSEELTERLMACYGSFSAAVEAPYEELCRILGKRESVAALLYLFPKLYRRYEQTKLDLAKGYFSSQTALYEYIVSRFAGFREEQVQIMLLHEDGRLCYCGPLAVGSYNGVNLAPREITAVCYTHGCRNVLLMHNHPSGYTTPSKEDILNTRKIKRALNEISIYLYDHVIVADGEYLSMRILGLIDF